MTLKEWAKALLAITSGVAVAAFAVWLAAHDTNGVECHPDCAKMELTPKERYCKQQAGWHPDCNLE